MIHPGSNSSYSLILSPIGSFTHSWPVCHLVALLGYCSSAYIHSLDCNITCSSPLCVSSGISRSLESVVSGHRPRAQTVGVIRVDQQGRLMPPVLVAHSMVAKQDPRRFSEASIIPPPRPPPPNMKRLNLKSQRRPPHPGPGTSWPSPLVMAPSGQTQPQPQPQTQHQPQHQPQQAFGGSNLVKMSQMARSTPQLDDYTDVRERDRERERNRDREKSPHVQNTRDSLIPQVSVSFIIVFFFRGKTCSVY